MKNDKRFDLVLDSSNPNFVEELTSALGVSKGDTINIITPQFERTDGRVITYLPNTPEEYEALRSLPPDTLIKIGCQVWDKDSRGTHWLFPHEWFEHIPEGLEVVSICDRKFKFKKDEADDDMRFGALSFGFIQENHS